MNALTLLGLATALGFLVAIQGVWMYSELAKHQVWFKLGEPKRAVLYFEWALGGLAMFTLAKLLFA